VFVYVYVDMCVCGCVREEKKNLRERKSVRTINPIQLEYLQSPLRPSQLGLLLTPKQQEEPQLYEEEEEDCREAAFVVHSLPSRPVRSIEQRGPAICNYRSSHRSGPEGECKQGRELRTHPDPWSSAVGICHMESG
jgi:hypothetical protein